MVDQEVNSGPAEIVEMGEGVSEAHYIDLAENTIPPKEKEPEEKPELQEEAETEKPKSEDPTPDVEKEEKPVESEKDSKEDDVSSETPETDEETDSEEEKEPVIPEITDDTIIEIDEQPISIKELKDAWPMVQQANTVLDEFRNWSSLVQEKGPMEGALQIYRDMYPNDPQGAYDEFVKGAHALIQADLEEWNQLEAITDPALREEFIRNRQLAQQVPYYQNQLTPLLEQQQKQADEFTALEKRQQAEQQIYQSLEAVGFKDRQDLAQDVATYMITSRDNGVEITLQQATNKVAYMERKREAMVEARAKEQEKKQKKQEVEKALDKQSGIGSSTQKKDEDVSWEEYREGRIVDIYTR